MRACCLLPDCLRTRGCGPAHKHSIRCDDLALALMNMGRIEQVATAPPHQEFWTPAANRIMPPPPRRRFARLVFRQLRKPEDLAPHLPRRRQFVAIGTDAERNAQ